MAPCSTTTLYHYFLFARGIADSILEQGLLPLSAWPETERYQQSSGFYQLLYQALAEPILNRPYAHSGIFLTQIDFRALPGSLLERHPRVAIPVTAIPAGSAVLTWERAGERIVRPFSPEGLAEAAALWDEAAVRNGFGRDPSKLFFRCAAGGSLSGSPSGSTGVDRVISARARAFVGPRFLLETNLIHTTGFPLAEQDGRLLVASARTTIYNRSYQRAATPSREPG